MQPIRSSARAIALLALVATLVATAASGHGGDDIACEAGAVVTHDASAHRLTAAGTPASHAPQHCWLCHWTRAISAVPAGTCAVHTPTDDIVVVRTPADAPADAARTGLTPGRAPPA